MQLVILGFSTILLTLYSTKAFMLHKTYKDSVYTVLFPSFLEYFFKVSIRKDCSSSFFLKQQIGTNHLTFATIQNSEHKITSQIAVVFYNKGIACISFLNPKGSLSGKTNDKHWRIDRDNKVYQIYNPLIECEKYSQRLQSFIPDVPVHNFIAISNDTDISRLKSKAYPFNELIDGLKEVNSLFISEEMIHETYHKLTCSTNTK